MVPFLLFQLTSGAAVDQPLYTYARGLAVRSSQAIVVQARSSAARNVLVRPDGGARDVQVKP